MIDGFFIGQNYKLPLFSYTYVALSYTYVALRFLRSGFNLKLYIKQCKPNRRQGDQEHSNVYLNWTHPKTLDNYGICSNKKLAE